MNRAYMIRFFIVLAVIGCASLTPVRAADMQYPISIASAKDGAIFVADKDMHGIWKIYAGKIEPFFQGSKKFRTPLNAVWCVGIDSKGRVVAGDSSTREIHRFNSQNQPEPLTTGG